MSTKSKSKNKEGKIKTKSEAKFLELENQFILRLPEPYATALNEALNTGGLKERFQVKFEDERRAVATFDGVTFSAKLFDLPCLVESWKTFDKKSLWKTGDICQVLVLKDPHEPGNSSDEDEASTFDYLKKQLHHAKKYQFPHGLTPPLKNVRKRRFRKTAKQKYVDAPEIEKEVKRLLRADVSAVDVKFEIVNDELEKQKQEFQEEDVDVGGPSVEHYDENSNMSSLIGSDNEERRREVNILPDISSSDDEDMMQRGKKETHSISLKESLQAEFQKRLVEIKSKKLEQEMKVHNAANPFLKQRFQSVLNNLIEEEEELMKELGKED